MAKVVIAVTKNPNENNGSVLRRFSRRMQESGVKTVRTMLARDDALNMAFFRSQGMMAGPFIPLEMDLDPAEGRG